MDSDRPASNAPPPPLPSKKLIIACDGTWLDSDSGLRDGKLQIPSNVTRICRAILDEDKDQTPQIVYYQAGVGTVGTPLTRVIGGATAEGLSTNIREAYNFICENYRFGDEIYLIGFSRGAFTARSVAGLIDGVGLLTKEGLPYLAIVFKDFENRGNPNYVSTYPNDPFPNKPSIDNPEYQRQLRKRHLSRLNIPIKAIGVWDTVGSLGIPRIGWLESIGLQQKSVKEYTFFDTSLGDGVEYAFQALALDEERDSFSPTIWEKPRGNKTVLRQVWFPGVHSNIGGGYDDAGMANITLGWMIAQLGQFIDFDPDYLREQYEKTVRYYKRSGQGIRPWSFGEILDSLKGVYMLGGKKIRTPGEYMKMDMDGRQTSKPLRDTQEYVHPSCRSRVKLKGPGVDDRGPYDCKALDRYKLKLQDDDPERRQPLYVWESRFRRNGHRIKLMESPLWETERKLLEYSPQIYEYILGEPKD